ncbi:MAG TPA: hypothetical protein VH394_15615, partial [Thermoanaerobaculia bacterium]|nr:hypothetical protein [Thermoanaerobaculia bacterium]
MRSCRNAVVLVLAVLAILTFSGCTDSTPDTSESTPTPTPPVVASACDFPTAPASSLEETAWQLFVAATCPSTGTHPLTFENWTEQTCLKDPTLCQGDAAAKRKLHMSHLEAGLTAGGLPNNGLPTSDCGAMTTASNNPPPSLLPFVPTNLSQNPTFCEEVFANDPEVAYIKQPAPGQSLLTINQQAAYISGGST